MSHPIHFAILTLTLLTTACRADGIKPLLVPAPSSPLKLHAGNLAAADVNGDGRDDLIIPSDRNLHVMLSSGDAKATFAPAPGSPVALTEPANELALGDVNGDGKLDLAAAGHDSYAVMILLGDGSGRFAPATGSPFVARHPGERPHTHGLALADFNGDKKLDVLTANQDDGDLALLLGDGAGTFAVARCSPFACGPSPYPFAVTDLDTDGHLDAIVPNTRSGQVVVLRGDGQANFHTPAAIKVPDGAFFVAAGDLSGDGKPDVVTSHDDTPILTVLLNDGRGQLAPSATSPLKLGTSAWAVAVRDMNGDDNADLVAAAKDSIRVLLGDGSGTKFTPAPGSPYPTGKGTWRLAIGDFNGDKKTDVAATCVEEDKVAILLGT